MTDVKQIYYIAVPDKVKYSYQSFPTWKNYRFKGTLFEAQEKAIELFIKAGDLEDNMIDNLIEYYLNKYPFRDEFFLDELEKNWDNYSDKDKKAHLIDFYNDYLEFYIDDFNRGLTLWKNVSDEDKRNVDSDALKVIDLS